jgi:hypothetical protein
MRCLAAAVVLAFSLVSQPALAQVRDEWRYGEIPAEPPLSEERFADIQSGNSYPIGKWSRLRGAHEEVRLHLALMGVDSDQDPDVLALSLAGAEVAIDPGANVTFKFDDSPIEERKPAGNRASPSVRFYDDGLIARLRSAQRLVVGVSLVGGGRKDFSFNVSGLVWE